MAAQGQGLGMAPTACRGPRTTRNVPALDKHHPPRLRQRRQRQHRLRGRAMVQCCPIVIVIVTIATTSATTMMTTTMMTIMMMMAMDVMLLLPLLLLLMAKALVVVEVSVGVRRHPERRVFQVDTRKTTIRPNHPLL